MKLLSHLTGSFSSLFLKSFFNVLFSFYFLLSLLVFSFSSFCLGLQDDLVFQIKRKVKSVKKQEKRKKQVPLKFQRHSFSYSEDFVIFNEKAKSQLKSGTVLKIHIPQNIIAGFNEEFQVYGIALSPVKAVLSGNIKAIKNTNKALISFDEIILNDERKTIEAFPVFLTGDLKESLFKDIALNFVSALPSAVALKTQIPQTGLHFINTDLKRKMTEFSNKKGEKQDSKKLEYLEIKNTKFLKVVVK